MQNLTELLGDKIVKEITKTIDGASLTVRNSFFKSMQDILKVLKKKVKLQDNRMEAEIYGHLMNEAMISVFTVICLNMHDNALKLGVGKEDSIKTFSEMLNLAKERAIHLINEVDKKELH